MDNRRRKEQMAAEAMGMVERIVSSQFKLFNGSVSREELRSYALMGLAESIERYDPTVGPFPNYAVKGVKGAILDGLCANSLLPRRLLRLAKFYKQSEDFLRYEASRPAPADKVSAAHRLANTLRELSCAYVIRHTADPTTQVDEEQPNAEEALANRQYAQLLHSVIETLEPEERDLVKRHYFKEEPLSKIAKSKQKNVSWASRTMKVVLAKLRTKMTNMEYPTRPLASNPPPEPTPADQSSPP